MKFVVNILLASSFYLTKVATLIENYQAGKQRKFKMYPISDHEFFPEDLVTPVFFEQASVAAKRFTSVSILNENRKVEKAVFYY